MPSLSTLPEHSTPPVQTALALHAMDARAAGTMVLLCLVWALQQISLKAAAPTISPMLLVALRSLIALALLAVLMRRTAEGLHRRHWRAGAAVGILFALECLLVSEALRLTQASHVVVFLYTAPLFAAIGLHWRIPAERLGAVPWAGILLAFIGITIAFVGGDSRTSGVALPSAVMGDALAVLAGAMWGATTITIRCSTLATAPAKETLAYQLMGAFVLLLPAAWFTGQWHFVPSPQLWLHLAFQGLVVSFASFLLWFSLLRRYQASRLGVYSFLTPLFGVVLGVWLLGEAIETEFVIGSALVLAGIGLVNAGAGLRRR